MLMPALLLASTPPDEGMWLPMFIERLNYKDMKKQGLKLSPEEIYSVNNSSLKDAIVMLGGGFCTAEVVSNQGLLLTNHHCAYDAIQDHSSVEHDYLKNGFWAMNKDQELPNEGLTASFLVRMEDVSQKVLAKVSDDMSEEERKAKVEEISKQIEKEAQESERYEASVKGFFDGNEYYLFVYETFNDVRLVGAPPESIGKYGGDTDNWMWPRHTGDFAMFRIYTDKDGKPAEYSKDNVPYAPKKYLPVSLEGYNRGDYAMVMGFPGSTDRYLTSYGVDLAINETNPSRVKIRGERLRIMKERMDSDPAVRIQYASKYASLSNYWKYFIGQTRGLKRLDVLEKKKQLEKEFAAWVNADAKRKEKYGEALANIQKGYEELASLNKLNVYYNSAIFGGSEVFKLMSSFLELSFKEVKTEEDEKELQELVEKLKKDIVKHFEEYDPETDKRVLAAMLELFANEIDPAKHPQVYTQIQNDYKGDYSAFVEDIFASSMFASEDKLNEYMQSLDPEMIKSDIGMRTFFSFLQSYFGMVPVLKQVEENVNKGDRLFVAGLREMNPGKNYYPNANSTLRVTYGQVLDYFPGDAMFYAYYTTAEGILEKEDASNHEFIVPEKLKSLIQNKDYGRYAQDGILPVAFITNLDITGGNSGSPVINAEGELIGIAFDGNWEAMSGDIAFEPELQRCIAVDIRYVLFVIDKFAGAKHLVDEMTLVDSKRKKLKEYEEVISEKY
ncbi:S46 family peptidase [Rapidithrix thailandica]